MYGYLFILGVLLIGYSLFSFVMTGFFLFIPAIFGYTAFVSHALPVFILLADRLGVVTLIVGIALLAVDAARDS